MTRPVTIFTGQWADLTCEDMCRLTHELGYDGIELCCWGDHFEVDKAATDSGYVDAQAKAPRDEPAASVRHLDPPRGSGGLRQHR